MLSIRSAMVFALGAKFALGQRERLGDALEHACADR